MSRKPRKNGVFFGWSFPFGGRLGLLSAGIIGLITSLPIASGAQARPAESAVLLTSLGYAYELPGGDWAERFGPAYSLHLQAEWLTVGDWSLGVEGAYLFGTRVKEDVLGHLRTPEGQLIGNDRSPVDIQLRQRGWWLGLGGSRLLRMGPTSRSGLVISARTGLLQHWIRIQDDPLAGVPQLSEPLKKGYDRLANGPYLGAGLGYRYLADDRRINLYLGLELTRGFTQNRRSLDYDLQTRNDALRRDRLLGLRLSWILPFYLEPADQIFY